MGSLAIVLWNGMIALGNVLPVSNNESFGFDSTNATEISTPGNEEEFPADAVDHYQHSSSELEAANGEESSSLKWYTMITKIPSDWSLFARNTFRSESLPTIAGIAGLTGILYFADNSTYRDMNSYATRSSRLRSWNNDFID